MLATTLVDHKRGISTASRRSSPWPPVFSKLRSMTLCRLSRLHLNRLWKRPVRSELHVPGPHSSAKGRNRRYEITLSGSKDIAKGLEILNSDPEENQASLSNPLNLRRANASVLGLADCCSGIHDWSSYIQSLPPCPYRRA